MLKFVFLFCVVSAGVNAKKLPGWAVRCNYKDNPCLTKASQIALANIANGVPEYKLDSLDPLVVPEFSIPAGNGVIEVAQTYKNLSLIGVCSHKLDSVDFDLEKGRITIMGTFEEISMNGTYELDGKVLLIPVKGNGPFYVKTGAGNTTLTYDFDIITRNDQRYVRGKKANLVQIPNTVFFQFDNLFDGNQQLGDNINKVLNENWKDIFDELGPLYYDAFNQILESKLGIFFNSVPISDIFLDKK